MNNRNYTHEHIRARLLILIPMIATIGFGAFLFVSYLINTENFARLNKIKNTYFPIFELSESSASKLEKISENLSSGASAGEIELIFDAKDLASDLLNNIDRLSMLEPNADRKKELEDFRRSFLIYYEISSNYSLDIIKNDVSVTSQPETIKKIALTLNHCRKILTSFRAYSFRSFHTIISEANQSSAIEFRLGILIGIITVIFITISTIVITIPLSKN